MDAIDLWILQSKLMRGEYVVIEFGGVFLEFNYVPWRE